VYPLVPLTSSILPAALLFENLTFFDEKKKYAANGREKKILRQNLFVFFSFYKEVVRTSLQPK
jgi:hypothetical protein